LFLFGFGQNRTKNKVGPFLGQALALDIQIDVKWQTIKNKSVWVSLPCDSGAWPQLISSGLAWAGVLVQAKVLPFC